MPHNVSTGYWNYRVLAGEDYAKIVEVYYDDKDVPHSWGEAAPVGNDLEDLKGELENMQLALNKPVLLVADLPSVITAQAPSRPRITGYASNTDVKGTPHAN